MPAGFALVLVAVAGYGAYLFVSGSILRALSDGRMVEADYWSEEPKILSAGYGFDGILEPVIDALDEPKRVSREP